MLILYVGDLHFSGWSMRGRIAMREKNVGFEERCVELDWTTTENADGVLTVGDLPEEREAHIGCQCLFADLAALDSEGALAGSVVQNLPRVPVLVDTETRVVAADVVSIAEYLDEIAPASGTQLMGRTAAQRAQIRSLCAWASHDLSLLVYGASYAKSLRRQKQSPVEPGAIEQAHWVCDIVAALLDGSGGPWVVGDFSLADVMLSTYFQQMFGWGIDITDPQVADYAQRLLQRPSVSDHLDEARSVYDAIVEADMGSPLWVLRHYRYNRVHKLLHDWQADTCVRVGNATAERIVDLAYAGGTIGEIAAVVAAEYNAPFEQVASDVRQLLDRLTPPYESSAA